MTCKPELRSSDKTATYRNSCIYLYNVDAIKHPSFIRFSIHQIVTMNWFPNVNQLPYWTMSNSQHSNYCQHSLYWKWETTVNVDGMWTEDDCPEGSLHYHHFSGVAYTCRDLIDKSPADMALKPTCSRPGDTFLFYILWLLWTPIHRCFICYLCVKPLSTFM